MTWHVTLPEAGYEAARQGFTWDVPADYNAARRHGRRRLRRGGGADPDRPIDLVVDADIEDAAEIELRSPGGSVTVEVESGETERTVTVC